MKLKVLIFAALLLPAAGCGSKTLMTDYGPFEASGGVKTTEYRCDYDKVVRGDFQAMWDYCQISDASPARDYITYFIPPDIQSTTGYTAFLANNAFAFSRTNNSPYRYYQVFTGNDMQRLRQMDFDPAPPESFVAERGSHVYVSIGKKDLLARYRIFPGYSVMSLEPAEGSEALYLKDYNVAFQIMPYRFTIAYDEPALAGILGLPDYYSFRGQLNAVQKLGLNRYSTTLANYWKKPSGFMVRGAQFGPEDYAFPQFAEAKHRGGKANPALTMPENGFVNEYLPSYTLVRIEIRDGDEILATFGSDDILSVIIDYNENAALFHAGIKPAGDLTIRYVHEAQEPAREGLSGALARTTGAAFIYSAMAPVMVTDLRVYKYYDIRELPALCVDKAALTRAVLTAGGKETDTDFYVMRLNQAQTAVCSPTHRSVAAQLPRIMGE